MRANDPGTPQLRRLLEQQGSEACQYQEPRFCGVLSFHLRVLVLHRAGPAEPVWPAELAPRNSFTAKHAFAWDTDGGLWVADLGNHRILEISLLNGSNLLIYKEFLHNISIDLRNTTQKQAGA